MEILNARLAKEVLRRQGRSQMWVIKQLGIGRSSGYSMFRTGALPEDPALKARVIEKLSEILGLSVPQILIRPPGLDELRTA